MTNSIGSGLYFYPRGGSAQVVRYLAAALGRRGWHSSLAVGSLGDPGEESNASTFYGRDDLAVADYSAAQRVFERGGDPMAAPIPHHPSYEDRDGVADCVFARLDKRAAGYQIRAWKRVLRGARWDRVQTLHLHHLTPIHAAAQELFPRKPRITHLHGTELKFMAEAVHDPPANWRFAADWVDWMRVWSSVSSHVVCISEHDRSVAMELLGLGDNRVSVIPNGVDTIRFDRHRVDAKRRLANWRRWLVEDPAGWDRSGRPGTIRYTDADLSPFAPKDSPLPVLLFVGRFLGFKRVELLVRAYARARREHGLKAPLVIWGGSPGEWEGTHPHDVACEVGAEGIFFTGWRGHEELPEGLASADVLVAPSVDEPFGQVYLEAMACGLPVVGTATGGPSAFVNTDGEQPNGWLISPDDEAALTGVLVDIAANPAEVHRRGENAYRQIRQTYSWDSLALRFIDLYEFQTPD